MDKKLRYSQQREQIYKYLASGVIRGIGPKKAMAIVEHFGSDTLDVLENEPERLAVLKGISKDQAESMGEDFKKQHAMRTVMLGLEKYGYIELAKELCEKTIEMFGRDIELNGEMHEYYHPDTGAPINNPGFQNWNLLSLNMMAWLDGDKMIIEF